MEIKQIIEEIKKQSKETAEMIEEVNKEYIEPLDKAIHKINVKISSGQEFSVNDLNNMLLEICPLLYFANSGLQRNVGAMVDTAESYRLLEYNKSYETAVGTGPVRTAIAERQTTNEKFVSDMTHRAYLELKSKIDMGILTVEAIKKCHNAKLAEFQIFQRDQKVSNY